MLHATLPTGTLSELGGLAGNATWEKRGFKVWGLDILGPLHVMQAETEDVVLDVPRACICGGQDEALCEALNGVIVSLGERT